MTISITAFACLAARAWPLASSLELASSTTAASVAWAVAASCAASTDPSLAEQAAAS